MTIINLTTSINAPIQKVFDLSRSIDIHMETMSYSNEKAISGRLSGLIELGETVTWEGKHFGFNIQHESIISAMEPPYHFTDEQKTGHFKWLKHKHVFENHDGVTHMIDYFSYETPYGILGWLFDRLALKSHLTKILEKRSIHIKNIAENN